MPLYYFDVRDGDRFFPDDEGTRLAGGLNAARVEAFAALTDYARELKPPAIRRHVAVESRDKDSKPLLKALLFLEVEVLASENPEKPKRSKQGRRAQRTGHM
jgi:hypothetical protein